MHMVRPGPDRRAFALLQGGNDGFLLAGRVVRVFGEYFGDDQLVLQSVRSAFGVNECEGVVVAQDSHATRLYRWVIQAYGPAGTSSN